MLQWVVAGILSGIVCRYAGEHRWLEDVSLFEVNLVVAFVYIAFVGGVLVLRGAGRSPALVVWAGLVVVAWIAAARVGVATLEWLKPENLLRLGRGDLAFAGAAAGLVGGVFHAVANATLLPATRSLRGLATVAAVGAVAGMTTAIDPNLWVLFIVWQGAVAGATGYVVERA